jgi:hypothetical protein
MMGTYPEILVNESNGGQEHKYLKTHLHIAEGMISSLSNAFRTLIGTFFPEEYWVISLKIPRFRCQNGGDTIDLSCLTLFQSSFLGMDEVNLTRQHSLYPITGIHSQLIQRISASPIKYIYNPVITTTDYHTAVLRERDLPGPLGSRNRDGECTNPSSGVKSIEDDPLGRLINTKDAFSRIHSCITAGCK